MLFLINQFIAEEEQGRSYKLMPVDGGMGVAGPPACRCLVSIQHGSDFPSPPNIAR